MKRQNERGLGQADGKGDKGVYLSEGQCAFHNEEKKKLLSTFFAYIKKKERKKKYRRGRARKRIEKIKPSRRSFPFSFPAFPDTYT